MDKKLFCVICFVALLLVSCSSGSGSQYVGTWAEIKRGEKYTLNIQRNGDGFILLFSQPVFRGGWQMEQEKYPGVLRNEMLEVNNGFGTVSLAVDKATGHLILNGAEYKRIR